MSESGGTERDVLLWRDGTPLCRGNFLRDAARIAAQIPPAAHLLNLCEQREAFLLAFAAALLARRVQLMPVARGDIALAEVRAAYPDNLAVTDEDVRRWRASAEPHPAPAPPATSTGRGMSAVESPAHRPS